MMICVTKLVTVITRMPIFYHRKYMCVFIRGRKYKIFVILSVILIACCYIISNRLSTRYITSDRLSVPSIHIQQDINCAQIISGNQYEIAKTRNKNIKHSAVEKLKINNCSDYRKVGGFNDYQSTDEEKQFPIAFNILFHKDVKQIEYLLRTLYRPHNIYCLHVDGFSPKYVHQDSQSLAHCFHNIFIVSKTENIIYKSFSRLQADINCMSDHLTRDKTWKYLINIPGQQFPLKTNAEMVEILKLYNNSNGIEGLNDTLAWRYLNKHINVALNNSHGRYKVVETLERNTKPPHGIHIIKGSAYGIFSRAFINYIVNNQTAKDFLEWCRSVKSPDEYFWASLNHNPHLQVPGGYTGGALRKPWLATYVAWHIGNHKDECNGYWLRDVCVFGVGDLHYLVKRKELFANKFSIYNDKTSIECLCEWLFNRTISSVSIDKQYYTNLFLLSK